MLKYYFTWKEAFIAAGLTEGTYNNVCLTKQEDATYNVTTTVWSATGITTPSWIATNNAYYNEVLKRIFRYTNNDDTYFMSSKNEALTQAEAANRWFLFFEDMKTIGDEIIPVIKAIEDHIDDVMTENLSSSSSSSTKFNDTPQNTGTYTTDAYNTNVTNVSTTVNTPTGSIAEKIAALQLTLIDHYDIWIKRLSRYIIID